jgi:hypothetical protein
MSEKENTRWRRAAAPLMGADLSNPSKLLRGGVEPIRPRSIGEQEGFIDDGYPERRTKQDTEKLRRVCAMARRMKFPPELIQHVLTCDDELTILAFVGAVIMGCDEVPALRERMRPGRPSSADHLTVLLSVAAESMRTGKKPSVAADLTVGRDRFEYAKKSKPDLWSKIKDSHGLD